MKRNEGPDQGVQGLRHIDSLFGTALRGGWR
jgi:hypothetical protein